MEKAAKQTNLATAAVSPSQTQADITPSTACPASETNPPTAPAPEMNPPTAPAPETNPPTAPAQEPTQ